jgi:UrcA family protein
MNILKSIHRSPFSTFCSFAVTSAVCLLGATHASAGPPAGPHSITVSYRDLNLSTIAGATTLYERLTRAARSVCYEPEAGVDAYREWRSCYQAAIADAVAKVNSPLLTQLHSGRNPATETAMLGK